MKIILGFIAAILGMFVIYATAFAQEANLGVANYLLVSGNAQSGAIVSYGSDKGYSIATTPYGSDMIGVVVENPAISINLGGSSDEKPVISKGTVNVLVSTINGVIKKGDWITSSATPGVGQKAIRSGYVLGSALEDFSGTTPGRIKVLMNIHQVSGQPKILTSLLDVLQLSAISTYETPSIVFKYFVAGTIAVISVVAGFILFSRLSLKGIEALGRNPLAAKMIQVGILFNILAIIVVILSGVTVAFLVLRL